MLFNYTAIDETGAETSGSIDAVNRDVAISSLQRRGLVISSIKSSEESSFLEKKISFLDRVSSKDIVILSRQIATLFEAQVSALKVFRLVASGVEKRALQNILTEIADDLQGGSSISKALEKHPKAFSEFYVNMVRAGEESGKLDEVFLYLADYLDRTYEISSKARNALIYPAFVIFTFISVMILMLTAVIPRISGILEESGQDIPVYTKIVIGISNFFVNYGPFLLLLVLVGGFFFVRFLLTERGKIMLARFKIEFPFFGTLYKRLYLSRIADNMHTMLISGIPMVRALEVTAAVVGNKVYEEIFKDSVEAVKSGSTVSDALNKYDEIPSIMIQMIKIGEETGELGNILSTMAKFYRREVNNTVDTLVDLIEPVLIVLLGLGVGILLAAVLIPIYNISAVA